MNRIILLLKSHVAGYTRRSGTYVKPHERHGDAAAHGQMALFGQDHPSEKEEARKSAEREKIAGRYAQLMAEKYGHDGEVRDMHRQLAQHIQAKDAYGIKHLSDPDNGVSRAVFEESTGVKLPKQRGAAWEAIRKWGSVSDAHDEHVNSAHVLKVQKEALARNIGSQAAEDSHAWVADKVASGYNRLVNVNKKYYLAHADGSGFDLSKKGSHRHLLRPLIEAHIAHESAKQKLAAER